MTYRSTIFKKLFALLVGLSFLLESSNAIARCELEKTPLINEGACEEFIKSDRALNNSYRALLTKLDKDEKTLCAVFRENGLNGAMKNVTKHKKRAVAIEMDPATGSPTTCALLT